MLCSKADGRLRITLSSYPLGPGVLVTAIGAGSVAAAAGLCVGDVIA
jgi:S1-C subfamily serine protease